MNKTTNKVPCFCFSIRVENKQGCCPVDHEAEHAAYLSKIDSIDLVLPATKKRRISL